MVVAVVVVVVGRRPALGLVQVAWRFWCLPACLQDTAEQQEGQLRQAYADGQARAAEVSQLKQETHSSQAEAAAASAKLAMLESQLQVGRVPTARDCCLCARSKVLVQQTTSSVL